MSIRNENMLEKHKSLTAIPGVELIPNTRDHKP